MCSMIFYLCFEWTNEKKPPSCRHIYIDTVTARILSVPLQYRQIRRTRYLQQIAGPTLPASHVPIRQRLTFVIVYALSQG